MISDDTRAGRRYHHNGDFSGEVLLIMDETEVLVGASWITVKIPMEDLRDIVTEANRSAAAEAIEGADEIRITVVRRRQ